MASKCLCAADLDKRIMFQQLNATVDAAGHVDETDEANWKNVEPRWAMFETKGSREFFRGQQVAADITHQITIRFDKRAAQFGTKMRFKFKDRKFNIAGPLQNVDEKDEWLVFPAIEVA